MSPRRLVLAVILSLLLPCSLSAHAAESRAEQAANLYASQELAAAPLHSNLPDYSLSPEDLAKSQHLSAVHVTMHFVDEAWSILSLLLLLSFGVIAWMRDKAVKVSTNRWAQGYVFLLLYLIAGFLLSLPLDLYSQHLSLKYGLSVQSWASWFGDQAKAFALTWIIGGLLLMLLFWIIRKLPRSWWLAFWVVSIPIVLFGIFAAPYIEPLFFHYEPLQKTNPALVEQLEKVVQKGHMNIPPERMFLMKASAKLTTLNADVEGFGASKRVVVWDTAIAKMKPDEIVFVFGHESGHYVLNHIVLGVLFTLFILLVSLYVGYVFVQWAISRFGVRWGASSQNDWAALAVLLLAFSLFGALLEPVENTFSRHDEHAADIYGQEAIHGLVDDPQTTAKAAFDVLGKTSFADPNPSPLYEFWTYTHPSIGRRAAFATAYDPWAPGMKPKYFKK
ncbi:MAG TPA: M48 family metallopeptidase [Acidobacteriaceae bacterium]